MKTQLSRRSLIKNGAKALAFSTLTGAPFSMLLGKKKNATSQQNCLSANNFNVVLHGLFFIEVWNDVRKNPDGSTTSIPSDQKIRIVAPDCSQLSVPHVYRAGSWSKKNFVKIDNTHTKDYLSGWPLSNAKPTIQLPAMPGFAGKLKYSLEYFSLYLPYPLTITPLRVLPSASVNHSSTISNANFPLVVALTYDLGQVPSNPFMGLNSVWDPNSNFHIFAEPLCQMACLDMVKHSDETLQAAQNMFPNATDFSVAPASPVVCSQPTQPIPTDPCPAASNVTQEEENSLWELSPCNNSRVKTPSKKGLFHPNVNMPTCASIILTS